MTRYDRPLVDEPRWPSDATGAAVVLLDASSRLEQRLIRAWVQRHGPAAPKMVRIPPSRRRLRRRHSLEGLLSSNADPLLIPVRVAWLPPPAREGRRRVRLRDVLAIGDPRDPDALRQRFLLRRPDRARIVVGEPATLSQLLQSRQDSGTSLEPAEFVVGRAWLALERAERALRGNRFKVPKFLQEELLHRREFRQGTADLAAELERSPDSVRGEATKALREIAATHSTFIIDLVAGAIQWLYRRGYASINYDTESLGKVISLAQDHPIVFLPSHKSQLDRLILQYVLWENDFPPNHTAGGINMNFFPVGPLIRRSGVFFIRRSFRDDPVYKFTLRAYIDHLIRKRFSLEWYLEGGRSRSGKLLSPRYGLLGYVADAYRRGQSDDIYLVPTSIAYDQIQDVGAYASEQIEGKKEAESFRWMIGAVRALRRRHGSIHVRFSDPISLRTLYDVGEDEDHTLAVQKVAFEMMTRINTVTPITPTSIVTLAMLGNEGAAQTVDQIVESLTDLVTYALRRRLPRTERVRLDGTGQVQEVLDRLREHDIVERFDSGPDTVYRIAPDEHLSAAYYRNTIIHFFVTGSIVEMALAAAAGAAAPLELFWEEVMRLRDTFKFEFFFSDKSDYRSQVDYEMCLHDENWAARLEAGEALSLLEAKRPLQAHWALRPFLESYSVVADTLASVSGDVDEETILRLALERGRQYLLQARIVNNEAVSRVLFGTGIKLARNRGAWEGDAGIRSKFAAELRHDLDDVAAVARVASSR